MLDLEQKLPEFRHCLNDARVHAWLGAVPKDVAGESTRTPQPGSMTFGGERIVAASSSSPLRRSAAGTSSCRHPSQRDLRQCRQHVDTKTFFDRLRDGGIHVLEFNPLNPMTGHKKPWRLNNRDHRKLLVVDGRIAFTGGINISEAYSSAPSGGGHARDSDEAAEPAIGWRDTHIQIEGPVVAEFQKLFMDTWVRQAGEPLAPERYFPELKTQGDEIVRAISSSPEDPQSLIYLTLMSAITHAESDVHLHGTAAWRRQDLRAAWRGDAREDRVHRRRLVHHRLNQSGLAQLPA